MTKPTREHICSSITRAMYCSLREGASYDDVIRGASKAVAILERLAMTGLPEAEVVALQERRKGGLK